jgi:UDP-glucose-4-epimerase GalE
MTHVLVTGGAGFIGSHAAWRLRENGFVPVVLDDLVRGHAQAVKFGPLVKGDVADVKLVREICTQYKPAALMHFAALVDVAESVDDPARYHDNNCTRAKILFETVRDCGVDKIIFSSTAAVYGLPDAAKAVTEQTPPAPINPYGQSKLDAENALRGMDGVSSVILRYFNAAGAAWEEGLGSMHWPVTHLIARTVLAACGHVPPLKIFGSDYDTTDGTAVRDYIHVGDIAEAHVAVLRYLLDGGKSELFNLGSGHGHSVKEVIAAVERVTGRGVPHEIAGRRPGDTPRMVADAEKALKILGWQPQCGLDDIVKSVYAWQQGDAYKTFLKEAA